MRLFVALELPPAMRDILLAAMGGVAGARWQRDDQLHLTLRFIGEVDRHGAADIAAALAAVRMAPLELQLARIGSFVHRGRVDSIWAGVTPEDDVAALAKHINEAVARVGIAAESRAFVPHVTLARLGRHAGNAAAILETIFPATVFEFNHFALWESRLGSDGAEYAVLERYGIAGC